MLKLLLSLTLPALGIVIAALLQFALTTLWPGIQMLPSAIVSVDSYVAVLLTIGLCFLAGHWTQQHVPTAAGAACALIVPVAWFGFLFRSTVVGAGSIAWLAPLTLFTLIAALAPLLGVAAGWALSLSKGRRALHVV